MGEALEQDENATMDFEDIRAGVVIGIVSAIMKTLTMTMPSLEIGRANWVLPTAMTVGYILLRARREPAKLETWGITSRISWAAWAAFAGLVMMGASGLAATSWALSGEITFRAAYLFDMIEYLLGAFPQQFFLCSVGLASLSTLRIFRGRWRLPLFVGLVFGLAHFWTPVRLPNSSFPIQMVAPMPMGLFAAYYFLRFRTIVPLTIWHTVLYVLLVNWVQRFL